MSVPCETPNSHKEPGTRPATSGPILLNPKLGFPKTCHMFLPNRTSFFAKPLSIEVCGAQHPLMFKTPLNKTPIPNSDHLLTSQATLEISSIVQEHHISCPHERPLPTFKFKVGPPANSQRSSWVNSTMWQQPRETVGYCLLFGVKQERKKTTKRESPAQIGRVLGAAKHPPAPQQIVPRVLAWKGTFRNPPWITAELHLPPKTRFGDPKHALQGDAGKFWGIQGFLKKKEECQGIPGKFIVGIPNGHPRMIFLGRWKWPKLICWVKGMYGFCELGPDMGDCQTYGGRKTYWTTHPQEYFWTPWKERLVWSVFRFCKGKNRVATQRGGVENVSNDGGSKTTFWKRGHSWGFPPPLFFPPSHGVLWVIPIFPGKEDTFIPGIRRHHNPHVHRTALHKAMRVGSSYWGLWMDGGRVCAGQSNNRRQKL